MIVDCVDLCTMPLGGRFAMSWLRIVSSCGCIAYRYFRELVKYICCVQLLVPSLGKSGKPG